MDKNTYIATVDSADVQDAICAVMGDNVSDDIAQAVLDNYIEPTDVLAPVGASPTEYTASVQQALTAQIAANKEEISQFIDDMIDE